MPKQKVQGHLKVIMLTERHRDTCENITTPCTWVVTSYICHGASNQSCLLYWH